METPHIEPINPEEDESPSNIPCTSEASVKTDPEIKEIFQIIEIPKSSGFVEDTTNKNTIVIGDLIETGEDKNENIVERINSDTEVNEPKETPIIEQLVEMTQSDIEVQNQSENQVFEDVEMAETAVQVESSVNVEPDTDENLLDISNVNSPIEVDKKAIENVISQPNTDNVTENSQDISEAEKSEQTDEASSKKEDTSDDSVILKEPNDSVTIKEPDDSVTIKDPDDSVTIKEPDDSVTIKKLSQIDMKEVIPVKKPEETTDEKDTINAKIITSTEEDGSEEKTNNNIEYVEMKTSEENSAGINGDKAAESDENPLLDDSNDTITKENGDKEENLNEDDPITSDEFIRENQEGADEELCIIPDTERIISQEEKEAASSIPPLRELNDSNTSEEVEAASEPTEEVVTSKKYTISKHNDEELQTCEQCKLQRKVMYSKVKDMNTEYICTDACLELFKKENSNNYHLNWEGEIRVNYLGRIQSKFERKCVVCSKKTNDEENNLTWEIMDFCNEFCLSKYQKEIGSICSNCTSEVRSNSLGKYCVRFGNHIRQFCTSHCLEEYKKGLKVCSYCQQDMSKGGGGFLAPVGDKGQFKDFCSQLCMEKYDIMTNNRPPKVKEDTKCSVCKTDNKITIEFEANGQMNYFCCDRCFIAFSFVNNINPAKCSMCRKDFPSELLEKNAMFYDNIQYSFCSNSCQNIYIVAHRKIVPCVWCKVKKYNFDMIRRYFKSGPVLNMCSINCLSLFQVSINAVHSKKTQCNFCAKKHQPMYHLTMSDATIRNFCSYTCVMSFQNKFKKSPITLSLAENYPVPAGEPKKSHKISTPLPVITNVQSLAATQINQLTKNIARKIKTTATLQHTNLPHLAPRIINTTSSGVGTTSPPQETEMKIKHHVVVKPSHVPKQRNISTMCKTKTSTKQTQSYIYTNTVSTQTDGPSEKKIFIPFPVPIYVPTPLPMYSIPVPHPVPFPLPIPVPVFIPTTRNSAKGIMKEIKKIQTKFPTDPIEAEILMMAEMVAGDKKEENTDSESEVDDNQGGDDDRFSPTEAVDTSHGFGEDMLQMALKMATELDEPAVDLEGALTANTITAPPQSQIQQGDEGSIDESQSMLSVSGDGISGSSRGSFRGRKRGTGSRGGGAVGRPSKKRRLSQQTIANLQQQQTHDVPHITVPSVPMEPAEKPDAHLCLKYTFGVNAWKQWVTTKNIELEKSTKFVKPFKTEILQLTSDELNYSLCLFVKEVRKPNGTEYAPDTIYYLCLGIQQYLLENGRIDNIFCDSYYEQFTDSLDEIAKKFSVLYNDSHYIVTRVEEEHLWESKQLGAHSPHVLLSTLMFFNTKHFNLTNAEEHMQLSFSHIMKHWKRNPGQQSNTSKAPGTRNILLRFYPPQSTIQSNSRKKKVYEQQENDENPLRCPVKLYEFYLSKCPESVKTRNDVFYLLPERSCVPDSPVWYSTSALPQDALEKMLHRVKMVKEINVALLTS